MFVERVILPVKRNTSSEGKLMFPTNNKVVLYCLVGYCIVLQELSRTETTHKLKVRAVHIQPTRL